MDRETRSRRRTVRLRPREDELLRAAAAARGVSISRLVRAGATELAREALLARHAASTVEEAEGES